MERIIIHSDLNNFYASVERVLDPSLNGLPVAVCGDEAERHGVVLAKSEEAKKFGIKTGDTVWQAKRKCQGLVIVRPHFQQYMAYSKRVKEVYARYTDFIEGYGIDECWLDVTASTKIFPEYPDMYVEEGGERHFSEAYLRFLGDIIRNEVREEVGLTVSVGVSFNKIYAKLGSDLKKPDGTTVISCLNYKSVVFGLPVEDLLMVGTATALRLKGMGITTIGKLAAADDNKMAETFGKFGHTLLIYARGQDESPVKHMDDVREYKSIGNSTTSPKDLTTLEEVKRTLFVLSESVATRLRQSGAGRADTVHLMVRDSEMRDMTVQKKVRPTCLCGEIANHAYDLFKAKIFPPFRVRALGVTVSGFDSGASQITFDEACGDYAKREKMERCVDEIRKRYGYSSVQRGIILEDPRDMHNDVKSTHLIKPARFDDPSDPDD